MISEPLSTWPSCCLRLPHCFVCRATLEVTVKPQSGMPSPRERFLEEMVTSCCKSTVLSQLHPHTALSLTLQIENDDGMVCLSKHYKIHSSVNFNFSCSLHWSIAVVLPCWMRVFRSPLYSQLSLVATLKMANLSLTSPVRQKRWVKRCRNLLFLIIFCRIVSQSSHLL